MKIFENSEELASILRELTEAGLVTIIVGDSGVALFTLSAAITEAAPNAIPALLAGIQAITNPRHRA